MVSSCMATLLEGAAPIRTAANEVGVSAALSAYVWIAKGEPY